jgi:hypothetical protein
MSKFDRLGEDLREQLGEPPADWTQRQRRRLRTVQFDRSPPRPRPRAFVGAGLALAGALAATVYLVSPKHGEGVATSAPAASIWLDAESSEGQYRLPDGSTVKLEAGSKGRYSRDSGAAVFDLHRGRGYFEIPKRPNQDWTVVAGRYSVHVVGTRFSVNYEREGDLDVWVEEGRVAVQVPQRTDRVILEAGDELSVHEDQLTLLARGEHDDPRRVKAYELADPGVTADLPQPEEAAGRKASDAGKSASKPNLGDEAKQRWYALYELGQYREALRVANEQGFEQLTRTLSAQRLVQLSDAARLGGDTTAALMALRALEARFPGPAAARDSGFLIGRLHAQRGESAAAIRRLTDYLQRGEHARYSLEAVGRLMELHSRAGNSRQARSLASSYLQRAPAGPYQRLAESILGRAHP